MLKSLSDYIDTLDTSTIGDERKRLLQEVADYIDTHLPARLHFICTHNSRRSHLAQIWAQTFAFLFSAKAETFSGGTEATAFHPNAVAALQRAGFEVYQEGTHNPRYEIRFSEKASPMICYSKRFDVSPNPTSHFAAVMTCSEADDACPVVFGADQKIRLFYQDPKEGDGTQEEASIYDARCRQIATELFFVFSQLK